jgi:hypothetical protein
MIIVILYNDIFIGNKKRFRLATDDVGAGDG